MQHILLLVIALAGSDWNCTETDGLWDCQPAQPEPAVVAPRRAMAPPANSIAPAQSSMALPPEPEERVPALPDPSPEPEAELATEPELVAEPEMEPKPAALPKPSPGFVPVPGYMVQIGAYRDPADAQRAASELDYGSLKILPMRSKGQDWSVLILDAFETIEQARAAGDSYVERTGGSYWIRSSKDLVRSLEEAGSAADS